MEQVADETMMRNALGDDYEKECHPPDIVAPWDNPLWPKILKELQEVYDPEIPVNIYELGLVYKVEIDDQNNVDIEMTLTAPGCPVAGEMPGMIRDATLKAEGVNDAHVELVWDPAWEPAKMAETAKLMLNMF